MASDVKSKQEDSLTTITPVGTVCFPAVWQPKVFKDDEGKDKDPSYGLILVFDEDTDLSDLRKLAGRALKKKWGNDAKTLHKQGKLRLPFRDASDYEKYDEPFVEGRTMIIIKSNSAPGVVDARAKPILNQMDFYAGCRARCSVYAHAYDTRGNKGVTFLLNNVQKVADGERLSGRADAEDEFEPVEGASGSDDDDFL